MPYLLLFLLLFSNTQSDKVFFGKKQVCSSSSVLSREWNLKLKRDKTFEYTISEFNTLNSKMSIKDDTLKFTGFWQFYDDTLFLHSPELTKHCKRDVRYIKKGENLYSLGACIDSLGNYQVNILKPISRKPK